MIGGSKGEVLEKGSRNRVVDVGLKEDEDG